jgi:hypothetical protein
MSREEEAVKAKQLAEDPQIQRLVEAGVMRHQLERHHSGQIGTLRHEKPLSCLTRRLVLSLAVQQLYGRTCTYVSCTSTGSVLWPLQL